MRTLIVSEFVTLDGVMEAPGGEPSHPHTAWTADFHSEDMLAYKFQEVVDAGILMVGRVTYESFAGAWPTYEGDFADRMNGMPKVVVSTTLTDPEWANTTVVPDLDGVRRLKESDGGPIMVQGSAGLVHSLLDADLVDELHLMVFPISIGTGVRVFPDTIPTTPQTWRVTESLSFPSTTVRVDTLQRQR